MEHLPLEKRNLHATRSANRHMTTFTSLRRWRCHGNSNTPRRLKTRRIVHGSVRNKVRRLRRLVPGGRGLQPDSLLLRTADYILQLKLQVNLLQALSKLYK
ncbi:hypothetical protein AAC387_Pa03g3061 [Persea americana]|eukprot:TRINITY_DN10846_c0_g3_i1.p1 TRINITY_DN10846_c0_g3~~TRINITY_DN10846_c0_g3_i1.p1  ORF type:complete len:101 (+),score=13.51 TRINITY_DN10846_c0_g3_i1:791-1093(+)